jgi:hypothetical protein
MTASGPFGPLRRDALRLLMDGERTQILAPRIIRLTGSRARISEIAISQVL